MRNPFNIPEYFEVPVFIEDCKNFNKVLYDINPIAHLVFHSTNGWRW